MNYKGWQAIYMCWFSKDLYRAVVSQWRGVGYLYLFTLLLSVVLIIAVTLHYQMHQAVKYVEPMINQVPTMTLAQGKLKIDKPSPYYLKEQKTGTPIVTFDTDDKITELEGDAVGILVNSTQLTIKNSSKTEIVELSKFPDGEMTPDMLRSGCEAVVNWGVPIFMGFCLGFFSIFCAIQSLIYAGIGMGFAKVTNTKLTYGEAIRLSVVAMTPVILIHGILSIFSFSISPLLWNTVAILITIGYLYFGVFANSPEQNPGRHSNSGSSTPPANPAF